MFKKQRGSTLLTSSSIFKRLSLSYVSYASKIPYPHSLQVMQVMQVMQVGYPTHMVVHNDFEFNLPYNLNNSLKYTKLFTCQLKFSTDFYMKPHFEC